VNIACPSCRTKFRVPDEKVTGKTVRLRCSKCDFAFVHGPDGPVLPPGFEAAPAAGGYTPTGPSEEKAIAPFAALSRASASRVVAPRATMDLLAAPFVPAPTVPSEPPAAILAPPLASRPFHQTMDFAAVAAPVAAPIPRQPSPATVDFAAIPVVASTIPSPVAHAPPPPPDDPFIEPARPAQAPIQHTAEWIGSPQSDPFGFPGDVAVDGASAGDAVGFPGNVAAMPALPVDAEFGAPPAWDNQAASVAATVAMAEAQAFPETPPSLVLDDGPPPTPPTPSLVSRWWRRARPHVATAAQVSIAVAAATVAVVWGRGHSLSLSPDATVECSDVLVQQRVDPQGLAMVVVTGQVYNRGEAPASVYVDAKVINSDDTTRTITAIVGDIPLAQEPPPVSMEPTVLGPGTHAPFRVVLPAAQVVEVRPMVRQP
jgi:predicted Zn finger-like uncharacterized protein